MAKEEQVRSLAKILMHIYRVFCVLGLSSKLVCTYYNKSVCLLCVCRLEKLEALDLRENMLQSLPG